MPYADKERQKEWAKVALKEGYGKRLYARRKLQRELGRQFQVTLKEVLDLCDNHPLVPIEEKMEQIAQTVRGTLAFAEQQEEELRGWTRQNSRS